MSQIHIAEPSAIDWDAADAVPTEKQDTKKPHRSFIADLFVVAFNH
jgi:hypothetical protein